MLGDQAGDVADAVDVGVAVFLAEAEALRQVGADLVAVEHRDVAAELGQPLDQGVATVLLPEPERPVNQIVRPWRNLGGLVSLRISATAGRLNHSGSCRPLAR